jgi:hypothetical protein
MHIHGFGAEVNQDFPEIHGVCLLFLVNAERDPANHFPGIFSKHPKAKETIKNDHQGKQNDA